MTQKNMVPGLPRLESVLAHNVRSFRFARANLEKEKEKEKEWTLVLLYPLYMMKVYEAAEITVWTTARTLKEAIQKAQFEAADSQLLPVQEATDFLVIFACEGHVENLLTKE